MKVSIVIPAYNEEASIERTIKSLLNQTYRDFEIIVVDNNSKDKTREIASRYVRTVNETKQGYIFAVRRGIEETNGEILTICDADSIYPKKWLEKMVKSFKKKDIVAVYGTAMFYDTNKFMSLISLVSYTVFLWLSKFLGLDNTAGFNFLFRRESYLESGGYDPNWKWGSPDIDLGRRLKKFGKIKLRNVIVMTSARRFKKGGFLKTTKMFIGMWRQMLKNKTPDISYDEYNKARK
ncbi:MAG: glycosyltransferase family 2 protein [Athalassotoga sp.]|uniref:glycosyltransferase family 2 protein n=1 Tax=Athalassotoga sp. TaxID=2022597 RepID=UPI00176F1220|nr:glycosyltransferase family 2 protein [Mesoaciditoga lauensis]